MYEDFIASRVSELRVQKGVSAREMSLSIGQSENYINSIENGKTLPSVPALLFIIDYLGITPAEFFDPDYRAPAKCGKLLAELKRLRPEQIDALLGIVRFMK